MTVAGLLLAAGGGSRYGQPKALVSVAGVGLAETALATLRGAGLAPVVAVIGAAAQEVRATVPFGDATVIENPLWHKGMGSSLRAGLAALEGSGARAVVVLLVDTPGITAAAVSRVVGSVPLEELDGALVAAAYAGRQGHPVLLGRDHWAGVARLAVGDTGARPYLRAHAGQLRLVDCDDISEGTDMDAPAG
jgi:CTP:molybdopterin cytidylyltransferase MocA